LRPEGDGGASRKQTLRSVQARQKISFIQKKAGAVARPQERRCGAHQRTGLSHRIARVIRGPGERSREIARDHAIGRE
jgi:hypothetical protein